MRARFYAVPISILLLVGSFFIWFKEGDTKYGVDFLGGSELVVRFDTPVDIAAVRKAFDDSGIPEASVQKFEGGGSEYSIKVPVNAGDHDTKKLADVLSTVPDAKFTVLKEDFVGPVIGEQIRRDGLMAIILSFLGILIYVSWRFEWRFAVGAIVALFHDPIICAGAYIATGRQINVAVLAAILTLIGYSVNDTIIIYDRIRENISLALKKKGAKQVDVNSPESFIEIADLSINQTLKRTILTSGATLLSVVMLGLFGSGSLVDLALTLAIGIIVGTYSSVYIACATILGLKRFGRVSAQN